MCHKFSFQGSNIFHIAHYWSGCEHGKSFLKPTFVEAVETMTTVKKYFTHKDLFPYNIKELPSGHSQLVVTKSWSTCNSKMHTQLLQLLY